MAHGPPFDRPRAPDGEPVPEPTPAKLPIGHGYPSRHARLRELYAEMNAGKRAARERRFAAEKAMVTCPVCGCAPGKPCLVLARDAAGELLSEGYCVPRGTLGLKTCSRCIGKAPGGREGP